MARIILCGNERKRGCLQFFFCISFPSNVLRYSDREIFHGKNVGYFFFGLSPLQLRQTVVTNTVQIQQLPSANWKDKMQLVPTRKMKAKKNKTAAMEQTRTVILYIPKHIPINILLLHFPKRDF